MHNVSDPILLAPPADGLLLRLSDGLRAVLTARVVAGCVALFLVASFLVDVAQRPSYPKSMPRVGHGDGLVGTLRNWAEYLVQYRSWMAEGYEKYSKQGRAFVVPSGVAKPPEIVVPRSQTAWMLDLPDSVLSADAAHDDVLYSNYNMLLGVGKQEKFAKKNPKSHIYHNRVVHHSFTRHSADLLPAVEQEMMLAVDQAFGDSADWHEVDLWKAWLFIVPRITGRVVVGEGLCRNASLVRHMLGYADAIVGNSMLLALVPRVVLPLAGRLLGLFNWWHWKAAHRILEPRVRARLQKMVAAANAGKPADVPEDYITWHIRMAMMENCTEQLNPVAITLSVLPVTFATIHTTVLTAHAAVLDLLCSDPADGFIDNIRAEVAAVRPDPSQPWTKPLLNRLYRTDSALRESMRVSNFTVSLVRRKVLAPEGITSPEGWSAPVGSFLVLNLLHLQHDPNIYPDPDHFEATRFSRKREETGANAPDTAETAEVADTADNATATPGLLAPASQLGMVTTSDHHLAFGLGRHACPGRFFVAHELKMVFAYLLEKYELQPMAERPQPSWIGQFMIPPTRTKVMVRRRAQPSTPSAQ